MNVPAFTRDGKWSMIKLSFDECNEPLFEELADVIRKELY